MGKLKTFANIFNITKPFTYFIQKIMESKNAFLYAKNNLSQAKQELQAEIEEENQNKSDAKQKKNMVFIGWVFFILACMFILSGQTVYILLAIVMLLVVIMITLKSTFDL
jgi:hypothetical protein